MKKMFVLLPVMSMAGCASKPTREVTELDISMAIANSQHVLTGQLSDSFEPDNDPFTIQYVFIKEGDSWVSEDGQVIYANAEKEKDRPEALLREAAIKIVISNERK